MIMYNPSRQVNRHPVAPNAAVVISAGKYFGASFAMKILLQRSYRVEMGSGAQYIHWEGSMAYEV